MHWYSQLLGVQMSPRCLCCSPVPSLKTNLWVFVWAHGNAVWGCLRQLQPKCSTVLPTSGLPPMRLLVTFVEIWLVSTVQESSILVSFRGLTCMLPKLVLGPVNRGKRYLMAVHSSPCSAGAGCYGTLWTSPQSLLVMPVSYQVCLGEDTHFLFRFTWDIRKKKMKSSKGRFVACL